MYIFVVFYFFILYACKKCCSEKVSEWNGSGRERQTTLHSIRILQLVLFSYCKIYTCGQRTKRLNKHLVNLNVQGWSTVVQEKSPAVSNENHLLMHQSWGRWKGSNWPKLCYVVTGLCLSTAKWSRLYPMSSCVAPLFHALPFLCILSFSNLTPHPFFFHLP